MKRILVIYYSQSGQLRNIIDNFVSPMCNDKDIQVDFEILKPVPEFPYPWKKIFFDSMPESVKGIPCKLQKFEFDTSVNYDLVIIGFQTWYLSPSIPTHALFQDESIIKFLKGKNIVTIQGVRNMWYNSFKITKQYIKNTGANYVGNVVLYDRTDNFFAGITVIAWMVNGIKKLWFFPESGVSETDSRNSSRFGELIKVSLKENNFSNLQKTLVENGAVKVKYHLMKIEMVARKIFIKFADYILKKGSYGNENRHFRVMIFKWYLLFVFFVLSPFVSLIQMIRRILFYKSANKIINSYKSVE